MNSTLTVTSKGQVTLRKEVLEHLRVRSGDKIVVEFLSSGRAEIRAAAAPGTIDAFFGSLAQPGTTALMASMRDSSSGCARRGLRDADRLRDPPRYAGTD